MLLVAGVLLAIVASEVDRRLDTFVPDALQTTADTGRATLSALCSAMFTVTGIVFSTTTVALSITSNQLGPRLLRNFLEQKVTQATLGICLGTSVFCLLLLRRVDKFDGEPQVPHGSILLAGVLAIATLMMIVYFIHRVTHSMQANHVASDIADDLDKAVQRLFPAQFGQGRSDRPWRDHWNRFDEQDADVLPAIREGYVQAIDASALLATASDADVRLRVRSRPGSFLRDGDPLLDAMPSGRLTEQQARQLQRAFLVGNLRTPAQDVECAANELVEIAVRALSPGVNDPFTAITCIDRLGGALSRMASREPPAGTREDESGELRLVLRPRTLEDVLRSAINPLRQHCRNDVAVTIRLLDALRAISQRAVREADRAAVRRQADMVIHAAREVGLVEGDLRDIEHAYERVLKTLSEETRSQPGDRSGVGQTESVEACANGASVDER